MKTRYYRIHRSATENDFANDMQRSIALPSHLGREGCEVFLSLLGLHHSENCAASLVDAILK